MSAEQRLSERVNLMLHTQIIDCATERSIGVLSDISLHGMRIVGERGIPPGDKLLLRLPLPVEDDSGASEIVFSCQSRWSYRDPAIDCFHSGLQMEAIDENQMSLLQSLIEEFRICDSLKN